MGTKMPVFAQEEIAVKRKLDHRLGSSSWQNSSETPVLKSVDLNRSLRNNSPFPSAIKSFHKEVEASAKVIPQGTRSCISKENNQTLVGDLENNPYQAISSARDSLRLRNEAKKLQAEIHLLEEELQGLKQKNDFERIEIRELEVTLIRKRRRVEKYRRLSEAQASYRSLLEKMIRDAMHQTVVYKEQLRLNQAASNALMARLETQRAICNSSEMELLRKYKQRDKMETQSTSCADEQARKRLRINDDLQDNEDASLFSSTRKVRRSTKKELREFLEAEQRASEAGISLSFEDDKEEWEDEMSDDTVSVGNEEDQAQWEADISLQNSNSGVRRQNEEDGGGFDSYIKEVSIPKGKKKEIYNAEQANKNLEHIQHNSIKADDQKGQASYPCSPSSYNDKAAILDNNKHKQVQKRRGGLEEEEEEEGGENEDYLNQIGKMNIEKWLQILLENTKKGSISGSHPIQKNDDKLSTEIKSSKVNPSTEKHPCSHKLDAQHGFNERNRSLSRREIIRMETSKGWKGAAGCKKSTEIREKSSKFDSTKGLNLISSPSVISGMRKSVDFMKRKTRVTWEGGM